MQRSSMRSTWFVAIGLIATLVASARGDEPADEELAAAASSGPPLWRVSQGDHELWLFGTLSAVPSHMQWSSPEVERAIAESQEVMAPPGARAAISLKPVELLRAWRRARELSRNPGDQELAQVVPPELYARYAALRERYPRRGRSAEHLRPIITAARIYEAALDSMGLTSSRDMLDAIERLARRADVEVTDTQLHVDPDLLLDQAALVPMPAELDCVGKIFAIVERGDEQLGARARAWARGDVDALRQFDYPDLREDCVAFPGWPEPLRATLHAADDKWFAAAERALATNRSTFGTLDLRELIAPNGLLARFRDNGYEVREPLPEKLVDESR